MLSYKSCILLEGMCLNLNAHSHIEIAYGSKLRFFPFFPLLYAHMQNTYFVPGHRDMGLLCFQAGHLLEHTDFSSAPIFTNSRVQKKDSGKEMLP